VIDSEEEAQCASGHPCEPREPVRPRGARFEQRNALCDGEAAAFSRKVARLLRPPRGKTERMSCLGDITMLAFLLLSGYAPTTLANKISIPKVAVIE